MLFMQCALNVNFPVTSRHTLHTYMSRFDYSVTQTPASDGDHDCDSDVDMDRVEDYKENDATYDVVHNPPAPVFYSSNFPNSLVGDGENLPAGALESKQKEECDTDWGKYIKQ